jgi:hypothetical protein
MELNSFLLAEMREPVGPKMFLLNKCCGGKFEKNVSQRLIAEIELRGNCQMDKIFEWL